jgi:MFS family permease
MDFPRHYGIGYAITSLIFVTNAIGFISAAFLVDALRVRIGRARTLMIATGLQIIGNIVMVCTPPFPVIVVSFLFFGLGEAINLAIGNTYVANLHNATNMLGLIHGSYGVGGTV